MKNFLTRSMTGAILAVAMIATVFAPPSVLFFMVTVVSSIGIYELLSILGTSNDNRRFVVPIVMNVICQYAMHTGITVYVVLSIVLFVAIALIDLTFFSILSLQDYLTGLFAFSYVGLFLGHLLLVQPQRGVLFVFLTSWGTDTAAYLAGMKFGKTKLIERVSPKKTVEGAIGGLIGAVVLSVVYAITFAQIHNVFALMLIALFASFLSQVGDLCASHFKRVAGVKDYGNLFRGHGGILDRFDSVLFAAPSVLYLSLLFGGTWKIL